MTFFSSLASALRNAVAGYVRKAYSNIQLHLLLSKKYNGRYSNDLSLHNYSKLKLYNMPPTRAMEQQQVYKAFSQIIRRI